MKMFKRKIFCFENAALTLIDCRRTIYDHSISTQKFRSCDEKNFGTSEYCNLENVLNLPTPQIWGTQVINEYLMLNSTTVPAFLTGVRSSIRTTGAIRGNIFNNMRRTYDAYEKDIALVNFYFKPSHVLQFGTQCRLGWIDFFSNVGGLLGLCLGLSIITFMEIIWICLKFVKISLT